MSLRLVLLALAVSLQAGFGLAWWAAFRRASREAGERDTAPRPGPGARRLGLAGAAAGLAGAAAGLAHAALARDPVFFVGQAMLLCLAWRTSAAALRPPPLSAGPQDAVDPDGRKGGGAGRNAG
jgi:hypothetical protein